MATKTLIVEDHPLVLRILKDQFVAHGFDVCTAASAQEAIEQMAEAPFDVVVTDMRMETDTAGFDVVQVAKRQSYRPVAIILSAFPIPPSDWRQAGADAMFTKQGGLAFMFSEIERLLRLRAA